jgi:hypothetical protein
MDKTVIDMLMEQMDAEHKTFGDDLEACKEGLQFLLVNVECALGDETDRDAADGAEVYYPGRALFEKFPVLTGSKSAALRAVLEKLALRSDLPKPESRDFIFIIQGYLLCGQEEARRQRDASQAGRRKP